MRRKPDPSTAPQRHLHEANVFVVNGYGMTVIEPEDGETVALGEGFAAREQDIARVGDAFGDWLTEVDRS